MATQNAARQPYAPVKKADSGLTRQAFSHCPDAELLEQALEESGTSQAEVARAWGVSNVYVSHILNGRDPLSAARIRSLPTDARRRFYQLALEELDAEEGVVVSVPVERQALRLASVVGAFVGAAADATADGVVTEAERLELRRALVRVGETVVAVERGLM
jgi:hypothetical protein